MTSLNLTMQRVDRANKRRATTPTLLLNQRVLCRHPRELQVTFCSLCQKSHAVNFAGLKLSSTKDQVPKMRGEMQEWLNTHPSEAA
jgi:hypothetical protein